jgi:hypothetical protein
VSRGSPSIDAMKVGELDLERDFDRVNHDRAIARIAEQISDKRMLKLIRACLSTGVMENGLVSAAEQGTPEGGPLSPLIGNSYSTSWTESWSDAAIVSCAMPTTAGAVLWKQWQVGRRFFPELRKRDFGVELAARTASSTHGD